MKAELMEHLFRAIFSIDIASLREIAETIITEERACGHTKLADKLEHIANANKMGFTLDKPTNSFDLPTPPKSKPVNIQLVQREKLRHHMVLPEEIERRLQSIEKEYAAKERLGKYNLSPKKKILLHGAPGCGKTMSAERIAWNLGLPLLKVCLNTSLSGNFHEDVSILKYALDRCKREPMVLLLDDCDFIARLQATPQDIDKAERITNILFTLLDEYSAPGLVIVTTKVRSLIGEAIFRKFDDIIRIPKPRVEEREKLLRMTLSAFPVDKNLDFFSIALLMDNYSYANVVSAAQCAAKYSILTGNTSVSNSSFRQAIKEGAKF